MNTPQKYTQINFGPEGINITYSVRKKTKPSGKIICYIPAFDFIFSANNESEIQAKSAALVHSFFDYYHEEESLKAMIIQIHKMGFRSANHNYVMSQFLHKKPVDKANMKIINLVPNDFKDAEEISWNSKLKMAS